MESHTDLEQVWTPQRISRFWDMVAEEPRIHHLYFSRNAAKYIINLARLYGMVDGRILDYGCGPGYLSKELIENGFQTTAIEYSPISADRANKLMGENPNWGGCFVRDSISNHLFDNKFSWVFSIEAFEHLRDEWIDDYFKDLNRALEINGTLFISTPNSENLDNALIICPCCEAKFHRWGHLRSVTADYLSDIIIKHGFKIELCRGIDLKKIENFYNSWINRSIIKIIESSPHLNARQRVLSLRQYLLNMVLKKSKNNPNLILIAKKYKNT